MRNIKIQFTINSLTTGGAERVASNLFNELAKFNKYKILFYTLEKDKVHKLNKKIKYKTISRFTLKTNKFVKIIYLPLLFLRYLKETKKNNPDILISFLEWSNFINILTANILRKKVIISVRTNPKLMYPNNTLYGRVHNVLIRKLYPKADEIIVVSKYLKTLSVSKYKLEENKVKIIYNPISTKEIQKLSGKSVDKKYEKIFKNSFVFINMGRLTEAKGQWFLIRVFKKVVEKHPNAKLIILGEGELKNKLQELINKLNLQNKVFLLGFQKNPYKFIKHSNCFVLSSLWEGLPNTIIETLSINIPIISTDCKTGPREILCPELKIGEKIKYPHYGKYGILTKTPKRQYIWQNLKQKPLTPEEKMLSNTMIKIIENKKLRKKYSKGLERAKDFNTNKIIKEWENVIKDLQKNGQ